MLCAWPPQNLLQGIRVLFKETGIGKGEGEWWKEERENNGERKKKNGVESWRGSSNNGSGGSSMVLVFQHE